MNRIRLLILLQFFACVVSAQTAKPYVFKHFSVNNGLASNSVHRVAQDKDGYIWAATSNGLQRYDGSSFITFKPIPNDPSSIPDVKIALIYADTKGNLWVMGGNQKIGIFDTRTFRFKEVPLRDHKGALYVSQSFFEIPGGELFLLRSGGDLLQYQPGKNEFAVNNFILPVPEKWHRNWVFWDNKFKKYWMACDSGLVQYDPFTKHLNYRNHNIDNDPVIKGFEKQLYPAGVFADTAGNLSFVNWPLNGAHPFIHRFNRKKNATEKFELKGMGYYEITYYLQQKSGRTWVYGNPFFAEWSGSEFNFVPNQYRNEQSIRFDYMYDVIEDKQNNIWLATDNGLYVFNPDEQIFNTHYFTRADGKPSFETPIQCMQQLPDGRIFVGSWGAGGVIAYDKNLNPLPLPKFPAGDLSTWDMKFHSKTQSLWICMQAASIVIYDPKRNYFKRVFPKIFGSTTIRQVTEDGEGNLWFGTHNGKVIKWNYKESCGDPEKGYELIRQTGLVHKICYDGHGSVWVATLGLGLIRFDAHSGKQLRVFTNEGKEGERLFNYSPTDVVSYDDSTLIVAAGCVNIINTKTNQVKFITDENGLPSNTAVSLLKDKNDIIWVGMENGICRFNVSKKLITYFDRRDGIADDKFNVAGAKALNDGRLAFFTDHSFTLLDPQKFTRSKMPPAPAITGFKLAGRALSLDSLQRSGRAALNYNNTSISINFSALSFLQQNKLHYYYMLEGLDEDWILTDRPIEVVYNYLAPGNYTFKVKSENTDGISNPAIAAFSIDVRAPFWKTKWFISLAILLGITVLYLVDKERMKRRMAIHRLRNEIRSNLKEEVSTGLNNIYVLSEMAKMKADKNADQAKLFIEQISEKSQNITEVMNDTLWSIDPENDSMVQTLFRMKEYAEDINATQNAHIDFTADPKLETLKPDMKVRLELFLFFKESIDYLINRVNAQQLFVNMKLLRNKIRFEIIAETDNEIFIDIADDFNGTLQRRIKALNAETDILADRNNVSVVLQFNA